MNRLAQILFATACMLLSGPAALAADANDCGYVQGNGGWYSRTDRSGPYSLEANCTARLLGTASSGGASAAPGSQEQDIRANGTIPAATLNATYAVALNGQGTVGFTFSGLTASGATLAYEQSIDGGTTWTGMNEVNAGTGAFSATRTTDGQIRLSASGRTNIRVRVSVVGTGTINVASNVSVREGLVTLATPAQVAGNDGTAARTLRTTGTGALEPPTADTGKIVSTSTTLTANTSTQLVAANANRIALELQCDGTAVVGVSRTGAALTSATAAPLVIPAGSYPLYTMPIATLTAVTAYTGTGQVCRVTEYLR